jgi:hypothetical protein
MAKLQSKSRLAEKEFGGSNLATIRGELGASISMLGSIRCRAAIVDLPERQFDPFTPAVGKTPVTALGRVGLGMNLIGGSGDPMLSETKGIRQELKKNRLPPRRRRISPRP